MLDKSVTTKSVTKQKLPKYKAEQPLLCQIDSLKRDINKKVLGKADTLIGKMLSCSRIKRSNSQTIFWMEFVTGVSFSDFTQHLRRKNEDVPHISFTLLDAAGTSPSLVSTKIAKLKIDEAGSLSKYERQTVQSLYTQGASAHGSIRNLAKTSRLPVSKMRQFLHAKAS